MWVVVVMLFFLLLVTSDEANAQDFSKLTLRPEIEQKSSEILLITCAWDGLAFVNNNTSSAKKEVGDISTIGRNLKGGTSTHPNFLMNHFPQASTCKAQKDTGRKDHPA